MRKFNFVSLMAVFILTSAFSLDLQSARSSGAVIEQPTGYIKAVKPSVEMDALVEDVNAKRKAEYERIAKEKGGKIEDVAAIAAQELLKNKVK